MAAHDFPWAHNKVKLQQSVDALKKRKELDPKIEINEESIRAEYEARAGLVVEKDKAEAPTRRSRAAKSEGGSEASDVE